MKITMSITKYQKEEIEKSMPVWNTKKYKEDLILYRLLMRSVYLCEEHGLGIDLDARDFFNLILYIALGKNKYAAKLKNMFPELTGMINDLRSYDHELSRLNS